MSAPNRDWLQPAKPYLAASAVVIMACTLAALWDLRVLLQPSPHEVPCADFAAAPHEGWVRLSACEAHLMEAVMSADHGSWLGDLAHGRFPTVTRHLFVPVWGAGEPPPLRLGVLVEARDAITLHTIDGLRDRQRTLKTLQGHELDMALAKLRTPEGIARALDEDEIEAFNQSVGMRVDAGTVVLSLGTRPEASTFSRVAIVTGLLALAFFAWRGRRAVAHVEPRLHDPALEFGQLEALRRENAQKGQDDAR